MLSTTTDRDHALLRARVIVVGALVAAVGGVTGLSGDDRAGQPTAAAIPQVDVFVAGTDGYHTYRIPAIIRAPGGDLLVFAEGRRGGRGDAGDIDLVMKRSSDDGRTWSAMTVVGDNGGNTFGNPCPVVDHVTGTIVLLTTQNRGDDREQAIIDGTSAGTRTVWTLASHDDGRTWSEPFEITGQVKRDDWTWYATGPGIGIQVAGGRLVVPANHAVAGTKVHRSHLLLSDDHGATWRVGGISVPGTNESQVVELPDGRLLLNMRNHPPLAENVRMVAISHDRGESLEPAAPDRALPEPPAQASLLRISGTDGAREAIVFANPAGPGRTRLTVRLSSDAGRTWPVTRVVHEGPAAYSGLVALAGDALGVIYERGSSSPYEAITFARLPIPAP